MCNAIDSRYTSVQTLHGCLPRTHRGLVSVNDAGQVTVLGIQMDDDDERGAYPIRPRIEE